MLEGAKQPLKHVSIADYLKLEICICIFSSYSVLACSFIIIIIIVIIIIYFTFFGGGMQVFFVLVKSCALECGMFPFLIS